MNCHECQELLQKRLDGDVSAAPDALEQHLQQCAACRDQHGAAQRLLDGLKAMPNPQPAVDFAATMAARVLGDRRQRFEKMRRRVVVTLALAASVLLTLLVAYNWMPRTPVNNPQPKQEIAKEEPKKEAPAPKKEEAKKPEPQNPLAALPDRMAETTRDHAKVVLAAASINDIDKLPVEQLPVLDPGVREAGQEVTGSVRVVSRNTRRAFDFFARELPMPEFVAKAE